jgi:uncharacterized membrane protein
MVRVWHAFWKARLLISGAVAFGVFLGWISLVGPVHIVETYIGLGMSFVAFVTTYLWLRSKMRRALAGS